MGAREGFVGFTASAFDFLHAGHVLMLEEAADVCDYLIVGLHVDPSKDRSYKNKPIETLLERWIRLEGCAYVDEIIPYETEADLEVLLAILPIKIRIIGKEYEGKDFTGREVCRRLGIHIHYNSRNHSFSSSGLRDRITEAS